MVDGKILVAYFSAGGSGIEKAAVSLKEHCPAAAWKAGKLVNRSNAASWAKTL